MAVAAVEQLGDGQHLVELFQPPVTQRDRLAPVVQLHAGVAAVVDHPAQVLLAGVQVAVFQARRFAQQAVGGEQVQEPDFLLIDAHRLERVEVQGADLDVFHAAPLQRQGGALAAVDGAFRADRRVVLVLDLQDVGVELLVVALRVAHAQLLIHRVRRLHGVGQGADIVVQIVVADRQRRLGVVLVAQVAHPQAGGVGPVEAVVEAFQQLVFAAGQERRAQRRRGAEQIHQQPGIALEVSGQVEIALRDIVPQRGLAALQLAVDAPELIREREVVVDPGDGLHLAPVPVAQADAVDVLHAAHVGAAVLRHRHVVVVGDHAGHGVHPQQFVVDVPVGVAVQILKKLDRLLQVGAGRGDEFQQRFGIVRGDIRMGQRRAQFPGVRSVRQQALVGDPQAFLLDATANVSQGGGGFGIQQCLDSLAERIGHGPIRQGG